MPTTLTTFAEFSDIIAAQQREINDIEVVLSGHRQTIDSHTIDITDLQDPPSGVPSELLDWLSSHSMREVDTILDADLTNLSSSVDAHTEEIASVSSGLDQEISDRTAADTAFSDTDTDLQVQITANLDTLTQEIADRSALSVTVSEGLVTVNDRIDNLQSDLSTSSELATTASGSMSSQIASLSESLQTAQTQILLLQGTGVDPLGALASQITTLTVIANDASDDVAQEVLDRKAADVSIESSIGTLSSSITGLNTSIANEASVRSATDLDIQSDVAALGAEVGGHGGLISAETAARTAADDALQISVDENTDDIALVQVDLSDEVISRTDADAAIQSTVDINTVGIANNTANIDANTTGLSTVKSKYGVVKDGGGYITDWWINDATAPPGLFKLKNLNSNVRLQAVGYEGKYFPAVSTLHFAPPISYDADWGGATSNDFHGGDGGDYTRNVKVYSTFTVGITGSCFMGVDYSTGGNLNRLGQVLTTFKVDISGGVNRYLSLWCRIKNAPGDLTGRWIPVVLADNTMAGQRTYERINVSRVVQIVVDSDKVIEFGLTCLDTNDASIADAAESFIYGGSVSITALNLTTIS